MIAPAPALTLSIVSHGHGPLLGPLLSDLENIPGLALEIILTFNIPEDESFLERYRHLPLQIVRNSHPKGFGSNHNAAFIHCHSPWFAVLNPDIRLPSDTLGALLASFPRTGVGAVAPLMRNPDAGIEDNARRFPQLRRLLLRRLGHYFGHTPTLDYDPQIPFQSVDWLAGMLIVFASEAYARIGGFDEAYFMYAEDIDIAKRLERAGYARCWNTAVYGIHDARRASTYSLRHFYWHCQSLWRYFKSH